MATQMQYHFRNPNPIVYAQSPQVDSKVGYSQKGRNAAKWFGIMQLILALLCVVSQAITTALHDHFNNTLSYLELYTRYSVGDVDIAGTGIWMGLFMVITSVIGVVASKQNRKSLIISHLVLNVFLTIMSPALIGASAISINEISYCRKSGIDITIYYWRLREMPRVTMFDEILSIDIPGCTQPQCFRHVHKDFYNRFYCKHAMFKSWIAFECILLVSSVLMFIVSLSLLVINSKAACLRCCSRCCCRGCSQSCAGCCCDKSLSTQVSVVSYQPQTLGAQVVNDGSPSVYPVYTYPVVQSTSQNPAPIMYPPYMYDQAANFQTANQGSLQPADVKSPLPPTYSE